MYGIDALMRKFGESPPMEWVSALAGLNDAQMQNGLRQLVKGGSAHVPTLPEFLKACREAREFQTPYKALPAQNQWDAWGVTANQHMLAEVLKDPKFWHPDHQHGEPGPIGTRRTLILVQAKNRWAQMMRESADDGHMDVPSQKGAWKFEVDKAREECQP